MPIEAVCPGCGRKLRVADQHAGKQARCPICSTIYLVPGATSSPAEGEVGEDAPWYMKTPEGQIFGPVKKHELDRWLSEGRVTAECQLRNGSDGPWQAADELYGVLAAHHQGESTRSFGESPPSASRANAPFQTQGPGHISHGASAYQSPHRGGLVLTMGILGWVFTCPVFSIIAWVMGASDLREMRNGRMDSRGMGVTQAGQILGMIYTLLWIAIFVILVFVFLFVAVAGASV
jgi:hypothetical protein